MFIYYYVKMENKHLSIYLPGLSLTFYLAWQQISPKYLTIEVFCKKSYLEMIILTFLYENLIIFIS